MQGIDERRIEGEKLSACGGEHLGYRRVWNARHDPSTVDLLVAHQIDRLGEADVLDFQRIGVVDPRFFEVDRRLDFGRRTGSAAGKVCLQGH